MPGRAVKFPTGPSNSRLYGGNVKSNALGLPGGADRGWIWLVHYDGQWIYTETTGPVPDMSGGKCSLILTIYFLSRVLYSLPYLCTASIWWRVFWFLRSFIACFDGVCTVFSDLLRYGKVSNFPYHLVHCYVQHKRMVNSICIWLDIQPALNN
jgi:hypothetical protein